MAGGKTLYVMFVSPKTRGVKISLQDLIATEKITMHDATTGMPMLVGAHDELPSKAGFSARVVGPIPIHPANHELTSSTVRDKPRHGEPVQPS